VVPPVFAGVRGPRSLQLSGQIAQGTILTGSRVLMVSP
jgi:hypothetical protein